MFQFFALVILFNSFLTIEAKPSLKEESLESMMTKTPITTARTCKVFIFPKLNWRTPFSNHKIGNKFRHVRVCKDTALATMTEAMTTTTPTKAMTTETVAEVIPTTNDMAKTKFAQDSLQVLRQVLLKEVCLIS